jgi:hypothetical protein
VNSNSKKTNAFELPAYLGNAAGPVPLVLDLRIVHMTVREVALTLVLMTVEK